MTNDRRERFVGKASDLTFSDGKPRAEKPRAEKPRAEKPRAEAGKEAEKTPDLPEHDARPRGRAPGANHDDQ